MMHINVSKFHYTKYWSKIVGAKVGKLQEPPTRNITRLFSYQSK